MTFPIKRKEAPDPVVDHLVPKKRQRNPTEHYSGDSDLEKAKRLSLAHMEAVSTPLSANPIEVGQLKKGLTPRQREIHDAVIEYFKQKKITQLQEGTLSRACLKIDATTNLPSILKVIDIPVVGKGVFLSSSAAALKKGKFLTVYGGEIQPIYQNRNEQESIYKWNLFDYNTELNSGKKPDLALKGWSEIVDGEKGLHFSALINACHPNEPHEANIEPRLFLLKHSSGTTTAQILYIASKQILPGTQLIADYGSSYFKHLGIDPLQLTPTTYTLDSQDVLISLKQTSSNSSASSSSSSSLRRKNISVIPLSALECIDLTLEEDEEESSVFSPLPLSSSSSSGSTLNPFTYFSSASDEESDYKEHVPPPPPQPLPLLPWGYFPPGPMMPPSLPLYPTLLPPAYAVAALPHPPPPAPPLPSASSSSSFFGPSGSPFPPAPAPRQKRPLKPKTANATSSQNRSFFSPPMSTHSTTTKPIPPEEISKRIERATQFLADFNIECPKQMEKLQKAFTSLQFPQELFDVFYSEIDSAATIKFSQDNCIQNRAKKTREKLHEFMKILWGLEELPEPNCVALAKQFSYMSWQMKIHSYFVAKFTKQYSSHRVTYSY